MRSSSIVAFSSFSCLAVAVSVDVVSSFSGTFVSSSAYGVGHVVFFSTGCEAQIISGIVTDGVSHTQDA